MMNLKEWFTSLFRKNSKKGVPKVSQETESVSKTENWSVMIYMAGDNNLSEEMVCGLQEMNEYFANDENPRNLCVAAQFDALGTYPRRYRFPNTLAQLSDDGPDGDLREYSKVLKNVLGQNSVEEDIMSNAELAEVELDSIAQETLLNANANPFDQNNMNWLRTLKTEMKAAPSNNVAGHFPNPPQNLVRAELRTRLTEAAKLLMGSSAASAQLQKLVLDTILEHKLARECMPIRHRAIILSGHGNGGFGDFLPDSDPGSALSIPDIGTFLKLLRIALPDSDKIDILGMDACLMSTLEVCYEVREHADYLVGAEGFVPLAGWPYQRILDAFQDDVPQSARQLVKSYYRYYSDYEDACVSTDISAIDLSEIGKVVGALRKLTDKLAEYLNVEAISEFEELSELSDLDDATDPTFALHFGSERVLAREVRNALVLARWSAQSYQWENQVDIWDFCDQLRRFLGNDHGQVNNFSELRGLCQDVKDVVDRAVLVNGWSGTDFQHSHGLSVYFPWSASGYAPEYSDIEKKGIGFAEASGWGTFLRKYFLKLTRRVRRYQEEHMTTADGLNSFRRQGMQDDPLDIVAFSNYRVRSSGPFNTRSSGPFNTRSSGPFNTRSSGPFNTKSSCTRVNNAPDGYYPTPPRRPETE